MQFGVHWLIYGIGPLLVAWGLACLQSGPALEETKGQNRILTGTGCKVHGQQEVWLSERGNNGAVTGVPLQHFAFQESRRTHCYGLIGSKLHSQLPGVTHALFFTSEGFVFILLHFVPVYQCEGHISFPMCNAANLKKLEAINLYSFLDSWRHPYKLFVQVTWFAPVKEASILYHKNV